MAYDKVVDSSVLDDGLQQIADAIREKGGTSASLAFPNAMAEAIAAIPTGEAVEQATPEIDVSSSGLITATAGDKSATKQLTTQAARTITPTTSNLIAVSAGKYTIGHVTVKGDANLKTENIAKGVSIFNVLGTFEGGGLPDGITEMNTGSFVCATDFAGGTYDVAHGLSRRPNYWAVYAECEHPETELGYGALCSAFGVNYVDDGNYADGMYFLCRTSDGWPVQPALYPDWGTDTNIVIMCTDTDKLIAGVTYHWIAAVVDGLK